MREFDMHASLQFWEVIFAVLLYHDVYVQTDTFLSSCTVYCAHLLSPVLHLILA